MTKILIFGLKMTGGGREGGTCEVLRPWHPPQKKIWNMHKVHCLGTFVYGKDDQRYSVVCNVKIFICFLISACHLTFTIIFYCHAVMNTFIQWQETSSDTYLTCTPLCFPLIEPNISLLPQGSLASIPSNSLIIYYWINCYLTSKAIKASGNFGQTSYVSM